MGTQNRLRKSISVLLSVSNPDDVSVWSITYGLLHFLLWEWFPWKPAKLPGLPACLSNCCKILHLEKAILAYSIQTVSKLLEPGHAIFVEFSSKYCTWKKATSAYSIQTVLKSLNLGHAIFEEFCSKYCTWKRGHFSLQYTNCINIIEPGACHFGEILFKILHLEKGHFSLQYANCNKIIGTMGIVILAKFCSLCCAQGEAQMFEDLKSQQLF